MLVANLCHARADSKHSTEIHSELVLSLLSFTAFVSDKIKINNNHIYDIYLFLC